MLYSIIIGALCFVVGVALMTIAIRGERRLRMYEFNNRTDGGVVQFQTYEASEQHERRRVWLDLLAKISIWPILAGVALMVIPVISYIIDLYS